MSAKDKTNNNAKNAKYKEPTIGKHVCCWDIMIISYQQAYNKTFRNGKESHVTEPSIDESDSNIYKGFDGNEN